MNFKEWFKLTPEKAREKLIYNDFNNPMSLNVIYLSKNKKIIKELGFEE